MYIGNAKLKQIILPSQRKECVWENLNKFHRIFLSKFEFIDPLEPQAFLSACHLAFLKTSCMTKERTMFNNSAPDPLSHFVRLLSLCTNATMHEISILLIKQPGVLFSHSFQNFRSFRDCLCIYTQPYWLFSAHPASSHLCLLLAFTRPFIREPGAKFAPREVCVFS